MLIWPNQLGLSILRESFRDNLFDHVQGATQKDFPNHICVHLRTLITDLLVKSLYRPF